MTTLLLIEDNPGDARLLREMLKDESSSHIELTHVSSMRAAEECLATNSYDIVLLDLGLPDAMGIEALRRAQVAAPRLPVVVLTGLDDESLAVQTLHEGAQDYLVKGQIETRGLVRALRYAVERKSLEDALFVEKERAQVTLSSIGDAVTSTDAEGAITFFNSAAEAITGWMSSEAVGRPVADVLQILDATTRIPVPDPMDLAARQNAIPQPPNCVLVRRDGSDVAIDNEVSPIRDREGHAAGAVIVFRDVTLARAMTEEMAYAAAHDFLTGLPNRMLLNDRIAQAIATASRNGKQLAVLFLDMDGFKHINDSLGHPVGDKLLQSIATRLVGCVRASDTVSRQGGDEFVVLIADAEDWTAASITASRISQQVADTAARLLGAVVGSHSIDDLVLHITASVGVSLYPGDGVDAETLIKNADTAMYQAKENGPQSIQFFKPAMNERAVERQSIEADLRDGLEREEFVLHYQPVVDLVTGDITGAEALIRWNHPTRGMLAPGVFIPVAEDCGLIRPLDHWVLRSACTQAREWIDAGLPSITMAVNVSAMELRDEHFLASVLAALDDTNLDPSSLELELTESVLMKHAESATVVLQGIRNAGIKIAIDDFGTGYSSLSYLRRFPVNDLKIDQSFISNISTPGDDTSIIIAVISMAKSVRLQVIAEGVETADQLAFLRAQKCDKAQGYHFSKPVPAEEFAELLEHGIAAARDRTPRPTPLQTTSP